MRTRDEALQTWCIHARRAMGENRDADGNPAPGTMCIAERCQAWRDVGENLGYCEAINFPPFDLGRMP